MSENDQQQTANHAVIERVWYFTGERNENGDLFPGAEIRLLSNADENRIVLTGSGRTLPHIRIDKTTPQLDIDHFKITELREKGNSVLSIKVIAYGPSPNTAKPAQVNPYWLIGGVAFLLGAAGLLIYSNKR